MAKRKNSRMIPRETRRIDAAARTAREESMTPEQRDLHLIALYDFDGAMRGPASIVYVAELWIGLSEEPDPMPYEVQLRGALARQYRRVTGRTITRDEAHSVIEPNYEEY